MGQALWPVYILGMPRHVLISARALADVDATITWMAQYSSQAAARWHAGLVEKIQELEERAESFPLAHEASVLKIELHELIFGKKRRAFRILYTISGSTVHVHQVRDAARDWLKPGEL